MKKSIDHKSRTFYTIIYKGRTIFFNMFYFIQCLLLTFCEWILCSQCLYFLIDVIILQMMVESKVPTEFLFFSNLSRSLRINLNYYIFSLK